MQLLKKQCEKQCNGFKNQTPPKLRLCSKHTKYTAFSPLLLWLGAVPHFKGTMTCRDKA